MVLEVCDKAIGNIKRPGVPIKMSGIDDTDIQSAPLLGEHNDEILGALNCDDTKGGAEE